MDPKVKSKLLDIFNSSFSSKNKLNKSQGNIILDTDDFFKRNIKSSSSFSKFPQYNYVNRSSKKDKIKDMLNKSFTELGFTNTRNNNKKTLFDNINTSTENYFGGKKLIVQHKEFDYDNFFKKIDEKKKKKNLNNIINFNNENNSMNRYLIEKNNNIHKNLKKKISAFANELLIEKPIKEKSYLNYPLSNINNNNNGNYSSPFNQKRINNYSGNNLISQIYNSNPSSSNTYNNSLKRNSKNFLDDLFNKTSQYSNQENYRKNNNNDDLFNNLLLKFEKKKVNKPYYFNNQKSPISRINFNF